MKTLLLSLAIVMVTAVAHAGGGGQEGNGGAGLFINGRPMTFGNAGIVVVPEELERSDIPGLPKLMDLILSTDIMMDSHKQDILKTLNPTFERKYFKVKEDSFGQEDYKNIIGEYTRLTNQPVGNLTLFAVTDTASNITYLLPNFYQLDEQSQMAILYHESYWLLHPGSDYKPVVNAEIHFQNFLKDPTNPEKIMLVLRDIGGEGDVAFYAFTYDMKNNNLAAIISHDKKGRAYIDTKSIFGPAPLSCDESISWHEARACSHLPSIYLYLAAKKAPKSLFLPALIESLSARVIVLSVQNELPQGKAAPTKIYLNFGGQTGVFWLGNEDSNELQLSID